MNSMNDHCIRICNSLLRGEISAGEAYGFAIDRFSDLPAAEVLRGIRSEHAESAAILAAQVRAMGGEPEKTSGAWGIFTSAIQGTANLFGAESAISSLKQGEEMGRQDYQDAILDDQVMPECKRMIEESLLPRILNHLIVLEKLEEVV